MVQIIGGYDNSTNRYSLNLTSGVVEPYYDTLPTKVAQTPASYVTLNDSIFFTNQFGPNTAIDAQWNFWQFNMSKVSLYQIGLDYAKPIPSISECYTTDHRNNIYLIGGFMGARLGSVVIFNTQTTKWSSGPRLNTARNDATCFYAQNKLYVIGGLDQNSQFTNSIEMLDLSVAHSKWKIIEAKSYSGNSAFYVNYPHANTAFIVASGFINKFNINNQNIFQVNKSDINVDYFAAIYDPDTFIYYAFDGWLYPNSSKQILYSQMCSNIVDLSASGTNIHIENDVRIPITLKESNIPSCNSSYLRQLEIKLNSTDISLLDQVIILNDTDNCNAISDMKCFICNISHTNSCWPCNEGLHLSVDFTTNKSNITVQGWTHNFTVIGFYFLLDFYFIDLQRSSIAIYPDQHIPIQITKFNLPYIGSFSFKIVSNNSFINITNTLNIDMNKDVDHITNCNICYDEINDQKCDNCSVGFAIPTMNNGNVYTNHNEDNILIFSGYNGNHQNNITISVIGFNVTMYDFLNLTDSATSISPGDSVPINVSTFLLHSNETYQFYLSSKNKALQVDNILHIKANEKNEITKCQISTDSNANYKNCDQGITPHIDYNYVSDKNNVFNISVFAVNKSDVFIIPHNGISVEISKCEPGFGMNSKADAFCTPCSFNTFTLVAGFTPCMTCPNHLNGIECQGTDKIKVNKNYWVSALTCTTSDELIQLYNITSNDTMTSSVCPGGFCSQPLSGCDYLSEYNQQNHGSLCAKNRNLSVPLCGSCVTNTYELFLTNACGTCDKTNYSLLLALFVLFAGSFAIYIAYFDSVPSSQKQYKEIELQYNIEYKSFKMLIFQVITYYYQALSSI
eukprot:534816_1